MGGRKAIDLERHRGYLAGTTVKRATDLLILTPFSLHQNRITSYELHCTPNPTNRVRRRQRLVPILTLILLPGCRRIKTELLLTSHCTPNPINRVRHQQHLLPILTLILLTGFVTSKQSPILHLHAYVRHCTPNPIDRACRWKATPQILMSCIPYFMYV